MTRRQPDAIDLMDVTDMCEDLGLTEKQARRIFRDAIAANLLRVVAVTDTDVILQGTFPDEVNAA
jgi:hypothetical protein